MGIYGTYWEHMQWRFMNLIYLLNQSLSDPYVVF